jgi:TRAP-type uncharacterized transport system substrate-binding protein
MRLSKIKLSDISNNFSYYEFKSEDKKYEGSNTVKMLSNISTKIHPGAVKFYKEIGASLADHH